MNDIIATLKNSYPKYTLKQPSTGKILTYRPFTVKEEKTLLVSKQSGKYSDFMLTITDIIDNCFHDNEIKINSKKLPIFDVEYMFLKLREKSISETINVSFVCPETKEQVKIKLFIQNMEIKSHELSKNIKISDDLIINMKFPPFEYLIENSKDDKTEEIDLFDMVISSIESIQTKTDLITDLDKNTLAEFINGLTKQQYQEILNFFIKIPKLEHTVPYITSDGVQRKITFRGIRDFFR